jgi:predicted HD phosphohydrolase
MEMECTYRQDKPPMSTWTGRLIYLPEMTPQDVSREDIAHALSLMCRGGGHVRYFYSVAQHSINCAMEAAARGYSSRVQLAALLHDGGEAYLSDLIRPVKVLVKDYTPLETHVDACVRAAFGYRFRKRKRTGAQRRRRKLHHEFLALRKM